MTVRFPQIVVTASLALGFASSFSVAWAQHVDAHRQRIEAGIVVAGENGDTRRDSLESRMAFYHVPGVSMAIINGEKVEWAHGYGVLDATEADAVNEETLFQAASVSKFVSAVGLLTLVEKGEIGLDDDVNGTLASWHVPENQFTVQQKVTLRRLLGHEAGINVHGFSGYQNGQPLPTVLEVLNGNGNANSAPIRVEAVPGSQYKYSGGGYCIAQQLAVDVTGQAFPDFMQSSVLSKLGMQHSSFEQPVRAEWEQRAASGHDSQGQVLAGQWHIYPEMAAAGLWTTPTDLARLVIEIEKCALGKSHALFSPNLCQQMLTKDKGNYGLGVVLAPHSFSHDGVNAGFRSYFICLDSGKGAVVMTNGDNGAKLTNEIVQSIAGEYGWYN